MNKSRDGLEFDWTLAEPKEDTTSEKANNSEETKDESEEAKEA